jgi:mono/diheme cytochrome c family protein
VARRLLALSLVGAVLLLAGCGGEETTGLTGADMTKGKALFAQNCASCHALADAGSLAQVGPNLDQAWAYSCRQGFEQETFYDIVLSQIDLAAPPMPADLVEGQDAVDVAAYVASAAAKDVEGCGEGGTTTAAGTTTGSG